MNKKLFISLLFSLGFLFLSCSLPYKLPSDGCWYNEELDIMLEFKTEKGSNHTELTKVVWNSNEEILHVHIGYGKELIFYTIDENDNEMWLLCGHFKYSNNKFIIIASELAEPFEISGTLNNIDNKTFVFTQLSTLSTSGPD